MLAPRSIAVIGASTQPNKVGPAGAVAILSISGGVGIMMADRAEELGFRLPPLPDAAARRLKQVVPFASP